MFAFVSKIEKTFKLPALALMYASRAVILVIFLLAPNSALTFYILAGAPGFTWLATVPPLAGLVAPLKIELRR